MYQCALQLKTTRMLYGTSSIKFDNISFSEVKHIIDTVIQRNKFLAHPENLLLAKNTHDDLEIHIEALQKILHCRKSP